jgi:hypothetical protein
MIRILGLNQGKLGGMIPGFIICLWSDGKKGVTIKKREIKRE